MLIVKDSMVIIHLIKTKLLDKSIKLFKKVLIPEEVYKEIKEGKEKHPSDINEFEQQISKKNILIKQVNNNLIKKANNFNIYRGEAETVALYWQENADLLATDDDNVRKKKHELKISVIGTPAIIIKLFQDKIVANEEYLESIKLLKKIGWFSSTVFDKMLLEVKNG